MRGVPLPQATRQLPLRVTVLPGQDLGRSAPGSSAQTPCPWAAWRRRCRKHLHRALRLPYLPGPLLRVQAWGHLNRRGLDPRELTLQGITGAKALLRFLPPTLEMPQSRWRIQGQLVSPEPQGPTSRLCMLCVLLVPVRPGSGMRQGHCSCAICPGRGVRRGCCVCAVCPVCVPCAQDVACALGTARVPGTWHARYVLPVSRASGWRGRCSRTSEA